MYHTSKPKMLCMTIYVHTSVLVHACMVSFNALLFHHFNNLKCTTESPVDGMIDLLVYIITKNSDHFL